MSTLSELLDKKIERETCNYCFKYLSHIKVNDSDNISICDHWLHYGAGMKSMKQIILEMDEALRHYENEFIPKNIARDARAKLKAWAES